MTASISGPASANGAVAGISHSLLVVDDCRLYREGLVSILEKEPDVASVHQAWNVDTVVDHLDRTQPNVVLINLASWESAHLISVVRSRAPESEIIAIGVGESDEEIVECAEAGVAGFLLRSEPFHHLTTLMRGVMAGDAACSSRASVALMRRLAQLADGRESDERRVPVLTRREDQVLRCLDTGLSNHQIAEKLGIELHTVKNHVRHIFVKLGVSRRGEAVAAMRAHRDARPADWLTA